MPSRPLQQQTRRNKKTMTATTNNNNDSSNDDGGTPTTTTTRSASTPAAVVVRATRVSNTAVVLHVDDDAVVTIDLCVRLGEGIHDDHGGSCGADGPLLVKSLTRVAREPAAGTLDRIRLLFQPRQPHAEGNKAARRSSSGNDDDDKADDKTAVQQQQQQTKKKAQSSDARSRHAAQQQTRAAVLARCPLVRVLGVAAAAAAAVSCADKTNDNSNSNNNSNDDRALVELDASLTNAELWRRARVLCIGATRVRVRYNVPTITKVTPPLHVYVGLPLVCSDVTTLFACDAPVQYEWCVHDEDGGGNNDNDAATEGGTHTAHTKTTTAKKTKKKSNNSHGGSDDDDDDDRARAVRVVSTDASLVPDASLLHRRLLLRMTVDREAGLWTHVELPRVQQPPPLRAARWRSTTSYLAYPTFRVLTYNILHDDFCTSKTAKKRIYPFATDDVLALERRQVRILQELLAAHADVMCLQECGRKLFVSYLQPSLAVCGYDGEYANKSGNVQEGCALFWRRDRYTCASSRHMTLNWATLAATSAAAAAAAAAATATSSAADVRHRRELASLAAQLAPHVELREALAQLTTIATVHVLRERATDRELVVGNTHLFYHANACHIRALQLYLLLHTLHEVASATSVVASSSSSSASVSQATPRPIVLCGDFNCTHRTAAYRLATTGQVEQTHPSWDKGRLFRWGCDRLLGCSDAAQQQQQQAQQGVSKTNKRGNNNNNSNVDAAAAAASGAHTQHSHTASDAATTTTTPTTTLTQSHFAGDLHAPLRLVDAYDRTDPALPWTNYTMTFREVIDYVFFSEPGLRVLRTLPIPPEAELAAAVALPNAEYPSDHLALVADLAYTCTA